LSILFNIATGLTDAGMLSVAEATNTRSLSATVSIDFSNRTIQLKSAGATVSTQSARPSLPWSLLSKSA
jgi:hypothetical protein